MTVTLPLPPALTNGPLKNAHWRVRNRARDAYKLLAMVALQNQRAQWQGLSGRRLKVRMVLYVWSRMDRDGMYARTKWPLDQMVKSGVMADDGPAHIELVVEQAIDRKRPRIELTLEAV